MLHLLPIRLLLTGIVALIAFVVLAAVYADLIGTGDALSDAKRVIQWSSYAALVLIFVPYSVWRWSSVLQRITFPYLGGEWEGCLSFKNAKKSGVIKVKMVVNHSLVSIVLILDSAESTSRTLVVHAEKDAGIERNRLYYVYLNERKEGVSGAGDRYRGLAVLRIEADNAMRLFGNYFTEYSSVGTIELHRSKPHRWWKLWK